MDLNAATPDEFLDHAGWLRSLALRLARDEAAADDLVQATWAAALSRRPARAELRTWLARVLERFARHERRGELRRRGRERIAAERRLDRSDSEVLDAFEAQRDLATLVAELSEPERTLVMRRYYEGMSAAEIGRRAGVPAATVRSQLVRVRATLRKNWRAAHQDDRSSGLAGLALIAGILPEAIQKGALMKSVHPVTWAAAAAVLVGVSVWGGMVLLDPLRSAPGPDGMGPVQMQPPADARAVEMDGATEGDQRVAQRAEPGSGSEPVDPGEGAVTPTRLLARIVDSSGRPVAGAEMDCPDRPQLGQASGDGAGLIALVADREHVPMWSGRPHPVTFRIAAEGYATRFERAGLELDSDTDLGDLELGPGGPVSGRIVGDSGAGLEGVRVIAGETALGSSSDGARLSGPVGDERRVETTTSADGAYRLAGVRAGPGRVWAHLDGRPWVFTPPIEVAGGVETRVPDLVLPRGDANQTIAGVVLGPGGAPVAGAVVVARAFVEGPMRYTRAVADEDGRFRAAVVAQAPHRIEAYHPDAELRPTGMEQISPGTEDVELHLAEIQWVELSVLSEADDTPLAEPWVRLEGQFDSNTDVPRKKPEVLGPGRVRAPVPEGSFLVAVSAPGYRYTNEGPFTPKTMPAEYVVRLERTPRISGRVLADGIPVADARVQTMRVLGDDFPILTQGFRARLFDGGAFAAYTDAEGRFDHPISTAMHEGGHALVVLKEGWATTEMILDVPESGLEGVEVVLTRGGAIEGHVLLPAGEDPRGAVVAACRGDDEVLTARADEEGFYRLEHLTPGPWQVSFREEDQGWTLMMADGHEGPYEGDCVVEEGRTTRYDLDQRQPAAPIEGRLLFDGEPATGWTARLEKTHNFGSDRLGTSVVLDGSGAFTLDGDEKATLLILEAPETSEVFARMTRMLEPHVAFAPANLNVATGRLTVSAAARKQFRLVVPLGDGWHYHATASADAAGRFVATLPAGTVASHVLDDSPGYRTWKPGSVVDVPVGGEALLEIE